MNQDGSLPVFNPDDFSDLTRYEFSTDEEFSEALLKIDRGKIEFVGEVPGTLDNQAIRKTIVEAKLLVKRHQDFGFGGYFLIEDGTGGFWTPYELNYYPWACSPYSLSPENKRQVLNHWLKTKEPTYPALSSLMEAARKLGFIEHYHG